jgi:GNAT superfamily N-acetyltransferase
MPARRKTSRTPGGKPTALAYTVRASTDRKARAAMRKGLLGYNRAHAGPSHYRALWVVARDRRGAVQGGLCGWTYWDWLFVEWLWVAEGRRKQGIGSELMRRAEQEARGRGCAGVYVDTFTFQAPDFYRKHGYREFGRLPGLPKGHARIWLHKAL